MTETAGTDIDRPKTRPFTLADCMIFITALGLGLALARPTIGVIADAVRADPRWRFQTVAGAVSLGRMVNIVLLNFLFFLLPAFLIVRLKRPRPELRSLLCQPGFGGCAAPVVATLATLPFALLPLTGLGGDVIATAYQVLAISAAPAAWVFLITTRRWNLEPSWIDLLGRTLSALWMLCLPAHFVLIRLLF